MPVIAVRRAAHVFAIAAILSLASAASFAQSQPAAPKPTTPTTSPLGATIPPAPVGHRQPRAADVRQVEKTPAEAQEERLQAELERKLKICRGC
jgi:hypothetical protein